MIDTSVPTNQSGVMMMRYARPMFGARTAARRLRVPAARITARACLETAGRRWASERGLSLVEVTIMLVILLILAGMLVPVMSDSITSARFVSARADLSQIAMALASFQRDVGPLVFDGARLRQLQTPISSVHPILLLTSEGEPPLVADRVPVETVDALLVHPALSLDGATVQPWVSISGSDLMDLHLRVNGRGYPESANGPGTGWNGPYLSKGVPGDPWGRQYLVNTAFLRGLPPSVTLCARCAVFVISAGPNGLLETPFQQPLINAHVFGDDLAMRIQ